MSLRRLVLLPAIAGLLLAAAACSGGQPSKIRIGAVSRADVAEVVEAPGTVTARATATLRAPAQGTIEELRVADGDEVHKGEVVAKVSSPSAEEQLSQARDADRQAASGGAVPAGVNLTAFRRQSDRTARQGFATARSAAAQIPDLKVRAQVLARIAKAQAEYAAAASAASSAVAQLNAGIGSVTSAMSSIAAAQRVQTRAAVRAAERTVKALDLKAPFKGVVSLGGPAGGLPDLTGQLPAQLQGQSGGQASLTAGLSGAGGGAKDAATVAEGVPVAGGDAIVTITDVSRLRLSADVDETDILQIKRGVAATVELDAAPGATYQATVTGVGATPTQSSGGGVTYKVTLSLDSGTYAGGGQAPWPKPGMSAVVDLRVREARSALSVPSSAIVTSGQNATVWVVAGGRAERRVVRLGAQGDTVAQVVSGLGEGERIVVRGADDVRQGQKLPGT
ncbi:MAG TPA: efflux RND transporter periplasmic adaptor subunit [Streptosporangiaceae bacterium]